MHIRRLIPASLLVTALLFSGSVSHATSFAWTTPIQDIDWTQIIADYEVQLKDYLASNPTWLVKLQDRYYPSTTPPTAGGGDFSNAVPEPSAALVFGLGIAIVATRLRSRDRRSPSI